MPNFLKQLTQSGALNVVNPSAAYQNALQMRTAQTNIRGAELDQEGKLIQIGQQVFKNIRGRDDLMAGLDYLEKLGMDPQLVAGARDIETDEEAIQWSQQATMTAAEFAKAKAGKPFTVTFRNKDGSVSIDEKMTTERLEGLRKQGLADNVMIGKQTKESFEVEGKRAAAKAKGKAAGKEEVTPTETPEEKRAAEMADKKAIIDYRAEVESKSKRDDYTPQQLVDDTRGYYNLKMKTLLDEDGFVKEGMEDEYKALTDQLDADMQLINKGEKPSWLTGPETVNVDGVDYEVVERLEDGSIRIKDPRTGKTGIYKE